jgi:hypothetical protein
MKQKIGLYLIASLFFFATGTEKSLAANGSIPAITFAGGANMVNGTIPNITFSGGIDERKAEITLVSNFIPANDESITIGTCNVKFINTFDDSDNTDCNSGNATISRKTATGGPGTLRNAQQIATVLASLHDLSSPYIIDANHNEISINLYSGVYVKFTTLNTESSSGFINFSASTGAISSQNSISGIVGVSSQSIITLSNSLAANATDKLIQIDGLNLDLGNSSLTTSGIATAIRNKFVTDISYPSKSYTVSNVSNQLYFTKKVSGTSGNGTSLTIQDSNYTSSNATAAVASITISAPLAENAIDHSITIDNVTIDLGTSAKTAAQIAAQIAATNFSSGTNYATGAYTVTNPSGTLLTFTKSNSGSSGNGSITISDPLYTSSFDQVATLTATPAGGTYTSAQSVTLSTTTSGAEIYYTNNNDTPSASSTKYTGAINLSTSQTIKAIAIVSGYIDSAIISEIYTINLSESASLMYRFQNKNNGTYIFAGETEKKSILDNYANTFKLEGMAFDAPISGISMYRFQNKTNGTYLFVGEDEKKSVIDNYSQTFKLEGLAFYTNASSGTPMYRFQNKTNGTYLFVGEDEKSSILANYSQTFTLEGLAFYAN